MKIRPGTLIRGTMSTFIPKLYMAPDFIRHGALPPVIYVEKARDPRGSHMLEANPFFPFPSLPHPHQVGRQAAYGVDRGGGRHPSGGGERGGRPPPASQQLESTWRRCWPISGSWQDISTQPIQSHKPNNQISQQKTIEQKFQKQNTNGRQRENFNSHGGVRWSRWPDMDVGQTST